MPERLAALHTKVLLEVQAGSGDSDRAHRLLKGDGFLFMATPTVTQEVEKIRRNTRHEFASALAHNILASPQTLDVALASFTDLKRDVTDIHVNRVLGRDILSYGECEGHLNALVEAAYLDCLLFITTVPEILEHRDSLTLSLIQDCGMTSMYIFAPSEIVQFFRERT